jgi:hypothetical protein
MTPYLTQWSACKFTEIKTTGDFYDKLLEYIKIFFPQKEIHAVSFLLHFPGISKERQWSHVDGTRKILQGSIMCGDWHASTLEFSVLAPIVSNAEILSKVWPAQPEGCDVFSKMASSTHCKNLLETYGHVLHHESSKPLNSLAIQAQKAPEGCESNYMAGTVIRMNGDTIHAGPPSCPTRCRGVFFFAASDIDGPKYDRHSQWNELTLSVILLEELWTILNTNERIYFLKIVQKIQSNPEKAPSDCSAFLPNMTLRLFAYVSRRYTKPVQHNPQFESFLKKIARNRRIPEKKNN